MGKELYKFKTKKEAYLYLAGFFDGEGSVSISRRLSCGEGSDRFVIRISISQKVKSPLLIFKKFFGNHLLGSYISKGRRRFIFRCNARIAKGVLVKLIPYLRLKSPQALLALKIQEIDLRKNPNLINKKRSLAIKLGMMNGGRAKWLQKE